jgi:hypothetical protein
VLEQVLQQEKFLGRQVHGAAVNGHRVPLDVHHQRAVAEQASRVGPLRAAKQRADARDDFVRAEWLGDVVIGSQLEPDDAVGFLGAGGEHDDRHGRGGRIGAQRAADFQPVEAGQHQVQQDQIGRSPPRFREHLGAGRQRLHREAGAAQAVRQQHRDVGVVLDHQQACILR